MPDFRVFTAPENNLSNEIVLSREESHHLVVVNRAKAGDPVIAFDGRGTEWITRIGQASKTATRLQIESSRAATPLGYEITLAQAIPMGASMDSIVRKATEIGARRIVPLHTSRTQVHLTSDRQDKKIEKWQIAALEAAKQCGNPWLPEIAPIQGVESFLNSAAPPDTLRLIASLHAGARPLNVWLENYRTTFHRLPEKVTWMIGPEGDFTEEEVSAAISAGYHPVTLGPLVLRCETAATYALSILSYELGS